MGSVIFQLKPFQKARWDFFYIYLNKTISFIKKKKKRDLATIPC